MTVVLASGTPELRTLTRNTLRRNPATALVLVLFVALGASLRITGATPGDSTDTTLAHGLQYVVRGVVVLVLGVVAGSVLASLLGSAPAGAAMSPIGLSSLQLVTNPWLTHLAPPPPPCSRWSWPPPCCPPVPPGAGRSARPSKRRTPCRCPPPARPSPRRWTGSGHRRSAAPGPRS